MNHRLLLRSSKPIWHGLFYNFLCCLFLSAKREGCIGFHEWRRRLDEMCCRLWPWTSLVPTSSMRRSKRMLGKIGLKTGNWNLNRERFWECRVKQVQKQTITISATSSVRKTQGFQRKLYWGHKSGTTRDQWYKPQDYLYGHRFEILITD